jgi:hypothetical protein|tara:strand:- start:92 stop:304 length:213 start_codon:yes stop_codon:yes gene_type:complete
MKFKIDEKEFDSEELSNNGKVCLARLQDIKNKKDKLSIEFGELNILDKYYMEQLKNELPKKDLLKEKDVK